MGAGVTIDGTPACGLEVSTVRRNGTSTVRVEGELDIANAPVLDAVLAEAERGARELLLDLGGVSFVDSTGLRSLLLARRRASAAGRDLRLRNLPPGVERVLEVTGLRTMFGLALR